MNIGANSITDTGLYFQWGDVQGRSHTEWMYEFIPDLDTYKYSEINTGEVENNYGSGNGSGGSMYIMNKYNQEDGLTTLQSSDDAVKAAWGGNWRMPTASELETLIRSCYWEEAQIDGVNGYMYIDKTDDTKRLFFPCAGRVNSDGSDSQSFLGYYWSSDVTESDYDRFLANCMVTGCYSADPQPEIGQVSRFDVCSIRGILDE